MAGTPPELVDSMVSTKQGRAFVKQIKRVALHGNNKRVNVRYNVTEKSLGTFDLYLILPIINAVIGESNDPRFREKLEKSLEKLTGDKPQIQSDFLNAYLDYRTALKKVADQHGYKGIDLYTRLASMIRNTKLVELYRGSSLWYRTYSRIILFKITGNPKHL